MSTPEPDAVTLSLPLAMRWLADAAATDPTLGGHAPAVRALLARLAQLEPLATAAEAYVIAEHQPPLDCASIRRATEAFYGFIDCVTQLSPEAEAAVAQYRAASGR